MKPAASVIKLVETAKVLAEEGKHNLVPYRLYVFCSIEAEHSFRQHEDKLPFSLVIRGSNGETTGVVALPYSKAAARSDGIRVYCYDFKADDVGRVTAVEIGVDWAVQATFCTYYLDSIQIVKANVDTSTFMCRAVLSDALGRRATFYDNSGSVDLVSWRCRERCEYAGVCAVRIRALTSQLAPLALRRGPIRSAAAATALHPTVRAACALRHRSWGSVRLDEQPRGHCG